MTRLVINNVDDFLVTKLKARAVKEHRSTSAEAIYLLELAIEPSKYKELADLANEMKKEYEEAQESNKQTRAQNRHGLLQ